jgi:hypothetical protein
MKALAVLVLVILVGGCAHRRPVPPPAEMSGFLDDYALLREGGPNELWLVYRNPQTNWRAYDKVFFEPVTLWRSGRKSLEPVPKEDLLRLVSDFQRAVRLRLTEDFKLVDRAGPGVMRVRLAITDARATDPILDILTASRGTGRIHPAGEGALDPETRRFLASAVIEGEIRDAETNTLMAEGVDRRRPGAAPFETWGQVDAAFAFWADRAGTRLEARTGR